MASAPAPGGSGTSSSEQDVKAARQIISFRVRDEVVTIAPNLIPLSERSIVRKAYGAPIGELLSSFDNDTVIILWWLWRRANGEPFLTLSKAEPEWMALEIDFTDPADFELISGESSVDADEIEEDDSSPES